VAFEIPSFPLWRLLQSHHPQQPPTIAANFSRRNPARSQKKKKKRKSIASHGTDAIAQMFWLELLELPTRIIAQAFSIASQAFTQKYTERLISATDRNIPVFNKKNSPYLQQKHCFSSKKVI
jgi:hypothetical protein